MPRVEKGTRIKGIPPRVLLNIRDNRSGSFPLRTRTSYDGRSGIAERLKFNDGAVVAFTTASFIRVGSGLPSGCRYYNNNPEVQTTFPLTIGNVVPNVVEGWIPGPTHTATPVLTAFKDSGEPTYGVRRDSAGAEFYATGSKLETTGPGFQQPLWSKTKIVVDIPVNGTITMSMTKGSAPEEDFVMGYHNFRTGKFYYPGKGNRREAYTTDVAGDALFMSEKAMGFYGSYSGVGVYTLATLGAPGDANGFPFDEKYFVPRSEDGVLYSLSESLSEPFLAEKIVVEFSGSYQGLGLTVPSPPPAIPEMKPMYVTFFMLNQRNVGQTKGERRTTYLNGETNYSVTHNSGSMDLVTYLQVVSYHETNEWTPVFEKSRREFNITNNGTYDWSGRYLVSGTVKSPKKYDLGTLVAGPGDGLGGLRVVGFHKGGRTGTAAACGRNHKLTLPAIPAVQPDNVLGFTLSNVDSATHDNPYLLLPTDKLIFGWQTAVAAAGYNYSDEYPDWPSAAADYCSRLSISGSVKVTIYGSHLKLTEDGRVEENHDTLNQLLSSNAIQEVIG